MRRSKIIGKSERRRWDVDVQVQLEQPIERGDSRSGTYFVPSLKDQDSVGHFREPKHGNCECLPGVGTMQNRVGCG
ncbi:MAG TPA: hypothetical protein VHQ47_05755 [Phycisphaerae bacterium]|nr:hypothetical protein [Phycisphaerae bacterium]